MAGAEPHTHELRAGYVRNEHPLTIPTGRAHRVVIQRAPVWRVVPAILGFRADGAMLGSNPANAFGDPTAALAATLAWAGQHPNLRLVALGHASPDGSSSKNDELSHQRARGVQAWIDDDRETWVDVATTFGSPTGVTDCLALLSMAFGWPCLSAEHRTLADGRVPGDYGSIVEAFQKSFNQDLAGDLLEDSVCGEETLGAIFDALRHDLSTQLSLRNAEASPTWHASAVQGFGSTHVEAGLGLELLGGNPGRLVDLILVDSDHFVPDDTVDPELVYAPTFLRKERIDPHAGLTTATLELVLRDAAGDPVPDAAYEVCFGERPIERGQLDAEGFVQLQVPQGQVRVDFPGFAPHAWFLDSTE